MQILPFYLVGQTLCLSCDFHVCHTPLQNWQSVLVFLLVNITELVKSFGGVVVFLFLFFVVNITELAKCFGISFDEYYRIDKSFLVFLLVNITELAKSFDCSFDKY